jgi:hypothetical protein
MELPFLKRRVGRTARAESPPELTAYFFALAFFAFFVFFAFFAFLAIVTSSFARAAALGKCSAIR